VNDHTSTDRPWLTAYADGVPADVDVPDIALTELLRSSAADYPQATALDFMGATTTYRRLAVQVARAAEVLRQLGVGHGDRVAIVLPNCPQHVVAFFAVLRLGAVVVEANPLYTADELAHQFADHGAEVVICWLKVAGTVHGLASRTKVRTIVAVDLATALPMVKRLALKLPVAAARKQRDELRGPLPPGALRWESLVATAPPIDPTTPGPSSTDVALLQYTGGTTGAPKGAILTHRNLVANALQSRAWAVGMRQGEEVVVAVLPLFHVYGLTLCLSFATSMAACLVLLPRFDVDQVIVAAKRRPPTVLPGVPPMYDRLAAAITEKGADFHTVRFALSGAMPLSLETAQRWEDAAGGVLVEGYGMTETSPIAIGNPVSPARRPGTVGVPFPSTYIRIVDPDDPSKDRSVGESGELLIRGPQVFAGYWNQPEETERTLLPGGWVRTGDIAEMDADGFVRIVDRIKELIITGGFNVYPSEVEEVLREHGQVQDVAVVGLPGGDVGEQVVAAVVPVAGAEIDTAALRAWARERLAGYKAPRRIVIVDDLPRSLIGKVLRREVRESLQKMP
jgi:long-chain acyl-CoA synthetase